MSVPGGHVGGKAASSRRTPKKQRCPLKSGRHVRAAARQGLASDNTERGCRWRAAVHWQTAAVRTTAKRRGGYGAPAGMRKNEKNPPSGKNAQDGAPRTTAKLCATKAKSRFLATIRSRVSYGWLGMTMVGMRAL